MRSTVGADGHGLRHVTPSLLRIPGYPTKEHRRVHKIRTETLCILCTQKLVLYQLPIKEIPGLPTPSMNGFGGGPVVVPGVPTYPTLQHFLFPHCPP
eukprot:2272528-Rhodomonas_salina.3